MKGEGAAGACTSSEPWEGGSTHWIGSLGLDLRPPFASFAASSMLALPACDIRNRMSFS